MINVCLVASSGHTWEQQWSYLLSNFKPDNLFIIGEFDPRIRPFENAVIVESAKDIDMPITVLSPKNGRNYQGDISILDYNHKNHCYLFGSDNVPLSYEHLQREPEEIIYIPTSTKDTMYSFMAGCVVFYNALWQTK